MCSRIYFLEEISYNYGMPILANVYAREQFSASTPRLEIDLDPRSQELGVLVQQLAEMIALEQVAFESYQVKAYFEKSVIPQVLLQGLAEEEPAKQIAAAQSKNLRKLVLELFASHPYLFYRKENLMYLLHQDQLVPLIQFLADTNQMVEIHDITFNQTKAVLSALLPLVSTSK